MSGGATLAATILANLAEYATTFTKTRAALIDAGCDEKTATEEARTVALIAISPQPQMQTFGFKAQGGTA